MTQDVRKALATEVCEHMLKLSDEARALLRSDMAPGAYVTLLIRHGLYTDALRFVAHVLPKPRAIWWGALCVWHMSRPQPTPPVEAALKAVVGWLRDPSENNRRHAEAAARAAGLATPAGALAMAVFWSGGSMAPPGLPVVEPDPYSTARTVAGAVLASSLADPAHATPLQRQFLALAREVADGKNLWKGDPS